MSEEAAESEIKISNNLKTELKVIFNPLFSTFGHGTRPEAAKEAMNEGLKAREPDLFSTTIPLFNHDKTYEEQANKVINQLEHWPHFNLKAIVIIMVPNPEKEELGGSNYFNSVFEKLPEEDTGYNTQFVIPKEYIKGYFDVGKKQFISNPNFKPRKPILKSAPSFDFKTQEVNQNVDIPIASKNNKDPEPW